MSAEPRTIACSPRAPFWPAVVACAAASLLFGSAVALAGPQYTRNPRFRIPFQADAAEMTRIGAAKIELHVSTDGGATWSVTQSVAPQDAKFVFEAPANGAYLFAVRTIDRQGATHPAGVLQPSLSVVVDDQRPVLTLAVAPVSEGEMEAVWQADDANLDLSTLRLEYLDAARGAWQPLNVSPTAVGSAKFSAATGGNVLVRGSVSDLAGNAVTADATGSTPVPTKPASSPAPAARPDFRDPIAGADEAAEARSLLTGTADGGAMLPMVLPNFSRAPVPTARTSISQATPELGGPMTPGAAPLVPGGDHHFLASPPLMQDVRHVNARAFRIGYELQDVGPSGIGSVDLYITEDGGSKWFHYGTDADRQSPAEIVVPRDGLYGFAIRVRNGLGSVPDPPQPGEPAEIGIAVDQTPPVARLMPLQQSAVGGANQIRIGWYVQDDHLAERPIALYQSASAEGPWEPITGWIENQGRFLWTVSSLTAQNVYIRLEVRDAAGNTTAVAADQPLLIDTSRPTARILKVETFGGARSPQ